MYREALEVSRGTLGDRHPSTLSFLNNLGALLQDKGDLAAAEMLYREALEGQRETLGSRHPDTLASINNLGVLLGDKGYLAAAEPLYREAVEGLRETLGNRHQDTLTTINNLGVLLQSKGNHAAGEPLCLGVSLEALDRHRVHAGSVNVKAVYVCAQSASGAKKASCAGHGVVAEVARYGLTRESPNHEPPG